VSGDEKFASSTRHNDADPGFIGFGDDAEGMSLRRPFGIGGGVDVLATHLGMTAVGHLEHVVEAAEYWEQRLVDTLFKDTKFLLRKWVLRDTVVVVESCLGRPTDIHC
jgi:hypothetical protein